MSETLDQASSGIPDDILIVEPPLWAADGGTWVFGRVRGYRFEALVFAEHAEDGELGTSRIQKLWIQRIKDRTAVFSWGEGLNRSAADAEVQGIVEVLATGLAERALGK